MKKTVTAGIIGLVAVALAMTGCAGSHQARKVNAERATLVNPAILEKGKGDQALYRYVNPKADVKSYNKVMIDPVLVHKDGELDQKELQNYQILANNAYVYLKQELEKDFQIVSEPQPGTMRVQMAIIDADSSKPVRNTLSTLMPIGMGISALKYTATGKQSGVGEITSEMKITDAATGELLGAAVDRRVGGKELTKLWSSWHNADDALKYWAKRLRFAICDVRGAGNCTPVD